MASRCPSARTTSNNLSAQSRFRLQGIVGGSKLHEFRLQVTTQSNESDSLTSAPTMNVQDAFNSGGAGQRSNTKTDRVEIADNFDFNIGTKHQMRVGILIDSAFYSSADERNALGTWTYRTIDDYRAGRPQQFSQRIGTLDIDYRRTQAGIYRSDDFDAPRLARLRRPKRSASRIDDKLNPCRASLSAGRRPAARGPRSAAATASS